MGGGAILLSVIPSTILNKNASSGILKTPERIRCGFKTESYVLVDVVNLTVYESIQHNRIQNHKKMYL